jgi:hypothetical protein
VATDLLSGMADATLFATGAVLNANNAAAARVKDRIFMAVLHRLAVR